MNWPTIPDVRITSRKEKVIFLLLLITGGVIASTLLLQEPVEIGLTTFGVSSPYWSSLIILGLMGIGLTKASEKIWVLTYAALLPILAGVAYVVVRIHEIPGTFIAIIMLLMIISKVKSVEEEFPPYEDILGAKTLRGMLIAQGALIASALMIVFLRIQ